MLEMNITKDNFQEEVMNARQKVLLDFWAPWCGFCRMVVPILAEISKERPDIKVGKINVDEQMERSVQFHVASIPTLLVMENGQIVNKAIGAWSKAQILSML